MSAARNSPGHRRRTYLPLVGLVLWTATAASPAANAAPGDLDATFAGDGTVRGQLPVYASSLEVQDDGRPLVIGGAGSEDGPVAVARYTSRGEADQSYDRDGVAEVQFGSPFTVGDGELTPDRTLTVAGTLDPQDPAVRSHYPPNHRSLAFRLTEAGSLDPTYGTKGFADFNFGPGGGVADIATTDDGAVVAVASTIDPTTLASSVNVTQLRPDGTINPTFGAGGSRVIDGRGTPTVALGADGSVFVGATAPDDRQIVLYKLTPSGSPDSTFGDGGRVITPVGSLYFASIGSMVVAPDGSVIVGAKSCTTGDCGYYGLSFDQRGERENPDTGSPLAGDQLAVSNENLIAATGRLIADPFGYGFRASRYGSLAERDNSFGDHGSVVALFASEGGAFEESAGASNVEFAPDGSLFVAGGAPGRHAIARFVADAGLPDRDADLVRDGKDRCPYLHARTRSGCPEFRREVTIRSEGEAFTGRVRAHLFSCTDDVIVQLMARDTGRDRRVASGEVREGKWRIKRRPERGSVYARVKEHYAFSEELGFTYGRCRPAKSRSLDT